MTESVLELNVLTLSQPPASYSFVLGEQAVSGTQVGAPLRMEGVDLDVEDTLQISVSLNSGATGHLSVSLLPLVRSQAWDNEFALETEGEPLTMLLRVRPLPPSPVPAVQRLTERNVNLVQAEASRLRDMLQDSYKSRSELQQWIKESSEQFNNHHSKQSDLLQAAMLELQQLKESASVH